MSVSYTSGFTNATVTPGAGANVAGGSPNADGGFVVGGKPDANTVYEGNKGQNISIDPGQPNLPNLVVTPGPIE